MSNAGSLLSLVVPVYNEAGNIERFLRGVEAAIDEPHEVVIVYDFPEDSTLPAIAAMQPPCGNLRLVHNTLGRGVLNAIKAGFAASQGDVIVVMMADCSDDPQSVLEMTQLIRSGYDVVAGSRYMRGGKQIGGPLFKRFLSRTAGVSLYHLAGVPVHDITSNFRAYSRRLIESTPIESTMSFVIAMELTLKAHWRGWKVTEVPTTWQDRVAGQSRFKTFAWLPHYLRWYFRALRKAWFGGRSRKNQEQPTTPIA